MQRATRCLRSRASQTRVSRPSSTAAAPAAYPASLRSAGAAAPAQQKEPFHRSRHHCRRCDCRPRRSVRLGDPHFRQTAGRGRPRSRGNVRRGGGKRCAGRIQRGGGARRRTLQQRTMCPPEPSHSRRAGPICRGRRTFRPRATRCSAGLSPASHPSSTSPPGPATTLRDHHRPDHRHRPCSKKHRAPRNGTGTASPWPTPSSPRRKRANTARSPRRSRPPSRRSKPSSRPCPPPNCRSTSWATSAPAISKPRPRKSASSAGPRPWSIGFTCLNARGETIQAVNLFSVTPWGTPQMVGVSGHSTLLERKPGAAGEDRQLVPRQPLEARSGLTPGLELKGD